ncbi:MAG: hypothetical protein MJ093_01515 [Saccharofermentans sp.]|nr:hypothetical protein [Saccharofermentans sp.]
MKKRFVICVMLMMSVLLTSCQRQNFIDRKMDDSDKETMYLTGDPQELSDQIFDLIIDADDADDIEAIKTKDSNNVTKKRIKEVLEELDGDIDDEECIYVDVIAETNEESKNDCAYYAINCAYYLTVDGDEKVLTFYVILVDEYEVYKHGISSLQILDYDDFNPDKGHNNTMTIEEAKDHPVLEYVEPLFANHHKTVMDWDEHERYPESRELMEEILYCLEDDDDDALLDLYSETNVNGKEDIEDIAEEQVEELFDLMGGEELSAVGGVVGFYDYSLKPSYVDCEDIDRTLEYAMRYIIDVDGDEYKIQVVYVPEYGGAPDDYVGIQSITIIEE